MIRYLFAGILVLANPFCGWSAEPGADQSSLITGLQELGASDRTIRRARAAEERIEAKAGYEALDLLPGDDPTPLDVLAMADVSLRVLGADAAQPWLERFARTGHHAAATAATLLGSLGQRDAPARVLKALRDLPRTADGQHSGIKAVMKIGGSSLELRSGPGGMPCALTLYRDQTPLFALHTSATASVWEMPGQEPWRSAPVWLDVDLIRGMSSGGAMLPIGVLMSLKPSPFMRTLSGGGADIRRWVDRLVWSETADGWSGSTLIEAITGHRPVLRVHDQRVEFSDAIVVEPCRDILDRPVPVHARSVSDGAAATLSVVFADPDLATRKHADGIIESVMVFSELFDLVGTLDATPSSPSAGRTFSDTLMRIVYNGQGPVNANVLTRWVFDPTIPSDTAQGLDRAIAEGATRAVVLRAWIEAAPARLDRVRRLARPATTAGDLAP
ncbi:MAG: hypothetical protein RLZZ127_2178 [Planctomycetota bacterium]|jgi:hypothetical protein